MRYFAVVLALGAMALLVGAIGPSGQAEPNSCASELAPDESIQTAIDDANSGATICLESGEWQESIVIDKSLTLRGLGDERVAIVGTDEVVARDISATVIIQGEDLAITLENLELRGAEPGSTNGIHVLGSTFTQSADVTVRNVRIADMSRGVVINGPDVSATLQDTVIENNRNPGVVADRAEQITIIDSVVQNNVGWGIQLQRGVQATVRGSTIRNTEPLTTSSGQMSLSLSIGVNVGTDSQLELVNSVVQGNGAPETEELWFNHAGVNVGAFSSGPSSPAAASAEIVDTRVVGNHSGVVVGQESDVQMAGTEVRESRSWGVAAPAAACVEPPADQFVFEAANGEIEFAGDTTIEGNNTSGRHDGKGNPGNHPFTDLPDGQVCLPRGESDRSDEGKDSAQAVPSECSVALTSDESIQAAIDDADHGATICLEPGSWTESVEIQKPLTLRGLGEERVTIEGAEQSATEGVEAVVFMRGENLDVTLQNLELVRSGAGIFMPSSSLTRSSSLTVEDVRVAEAGVGIGVGGQDVPVQIRNSVIENLRGGQFGRGIAAQGDVELTVANTRIVNNQVAAGLNVAGGATAEVRETTVRGTALVGEEGDRTQGIGINVSEGHLRLVNSVVRDNGSTSSGTSDAMIQNAGVNVGVIGLRAVTIAPSPASAEIVHSEIAGNRRGLMLGPTAELGLQDSQVTGNVGWGIATPLTPCVERPISEQASFNGSTEFGGTNTIEGNNTSGEHDEKGNPGDHPFADRPDGQVCLP